MAAKVKMCEDRDKKGAKALLKVTAARQRMAEVVRELTKLKNVASAQVYQKVFDRGFN